MSDGKALTLDQAWRGVMVTYTECDHPYFGHEYERTVPGWECTACGQRIGTSGLPPLQCPGCGQEYERTTAK